jgi:hypothetical protein
MTRAFLDSLTLTPEQIDGIMAEHGKALQASQAKLEAAAKTAQEGLQAQITTLTAQQQELQKTISEAPSVDDAVKKITAELEATHKAALDEVQAKNTAQVTAMQCDIGTVDFLRGLEKPFVTPETEQVFRQQLNTAVLDPANAGKNRTDIFAGLIKSADGTDRTDIFKQGVEPAPPVVPGGAGGHGGAIPPLTPPTNNPFGFTFVPPAT